jgi:hypothetical protein
MRTTRTTKLLAERGDALYIRRPRWSLWAMGATAVILSSGVILGWWRLTARGDVAIYSPGHVTSAHAMWDTNCAVCHAGDGHGGFLRRVSDDACLQCHSEVATVHNPHQSTMVRQVSLNDGSQAMVSSQCATCHIEHRGYKALIASAADTCVRCHRDVSMFTKGTPEIDSKVTRFAVGSHPGFGRSVFVATTGKAAQSTGQDPTPLIFSHSDHLSNPRLKPRPGESEKCTVCHELAEPGPGIRPDQRYMKPVSYEKHCKDCHRMELVAGTNTPIPHVSMDDLRPLLITYADSPRHFRDVLAAMKPQERQDALLKKIPARDAFHRATTVQLAPDDWVTEQAKGFWAAIGKWYDDQGDQLHGMDAVKAEIQRAQNNVEELNKGKPWAGVVPTVPLIPEVLEFYVTHPKDKNDQKCGLCHKLSENAALPATTSPAKAPSTIHFDTVRTGITSAPRRWYVNSVFSHSVHSFVDGTQQPPRPTKCTVCHAKAESSDAMTDILLPGIDTCVKCHHSPDETGHGAETNCLSCHPFYHDRNARHAPAEQMIWV